MPSHRHQERRQAYAPVRVGPDEPQRCCICLDPYYTSTGDEYAEVPLQLPCGHVFGDACIAEWMQTKRTCPLCRFEFFDIEFDHNDDEYDLWISETDSANQRLGTSSGHISTFSFVPDFPGERIAIDGLGVSATRSSTAAHRSFHTRLGGSLSAPPQYARQPYRHAQTDRRYGHGKNSRSYFESEDVWITALTHERDELAATGVGDGWIMAPDEDEDEAYELELYRHLYLCDASMQQAWLEDSLPDYLFDEMVAEHIQWMHEMGGETQYDVYDEFDYLV